MLHFKTTLSANSKNIADVTINYDIISRRCSVTLLLCITLNPLNAYGYRLKSGTTINHVKPMSAGKQIMTRKLLNGNIKVNTEALIMSSVQEQTFDTRVKPDGITG